MKKTRHFLPMLFLLLGCAVGTVSVVLALLSLNRVPLLWRGPEEAALCTQNLMEAICEGDYASASAQLVGAPDLGLDKASQSAVEQLLWEAYQGSCAFQESGGLYVTETGLAQDVQFESLDLAAVLADTKLLWPQLLTSYVEAANSDPNSDIYIYIRREWGIYGRDHSANTAGGRAAGSDPGARGGADSSDAPARL